MALHAHVWPFCALAHPPHSTGSKAQQKNRSSVVCGRWKAAVDSLIANFVNFVVTNRPKNTDRGTRRREYRTSTHSGGTLDHL